MPADTVPTTYDALLVRCRELEDENAALKAKPPAPAITPSTAQAIAAKLQGRVAPAVRATPETAKLGTRVLYLSGGYVFVVEIVAVHDTTDMVTVRLRPTLITMVDGKPRVHDFGAVEVVKASKLLLAPEGW